MTSVAVVAHAQKTLGGGLPELRRVLADAGVGHPLWYEVPKSKYAPKCVRRVLRDGADRVLVWGGDGMVQRCIDAVGDAPVPLAILPAGTGNLLARNLGIPIDLEAAVDVALHGARRTIDVGRVNGERFAVMAGTGLDALMIRDAGRTLKDRFGRAAYIWTGAKSFRTPPFTARITVDESPWFNGPASCILAGNVGALFAGVRVFDDAEPDDGLLDLAVITADGIAQWARTVGRTITGSPDQSPFFRSTKGKTMSVKLDRKVRYELDGGDRSKIKSYDLAVEPRAVTICVPAGANGSGGS
jgi:YegS/Rv2252/BmrU family lipid kinase